MSKVLKAVFSTIYRPSDTSLQEWNTAVNTLTEEVELMQSIGHINICLSVETGTSGIFNRTITERWLITLV